MAGLLRESNPQQSRTDSECKIVRDWYQGWVGLSDKKSDHAPGFEDFIRIRFRIIRTIVDWDYQTKLNDAKKF